MHQDSNNRAVDGEQAVARDAESSVWWRGRPQPIIQEQANIPQTHRRTGAKTARRDERKSRDRAHAAGRERTARSAWCDKHKRKAPPDMLTGRSVQECLSPTDHEARGHHSSGCGKSESAAAELCSGAHQRPKQKTTTIASTLRPSVSGPEQDSDVNAKEEEKAWCLSVQEATRSTWRNVRERTVHHEVQGATDRREQREVPSSFDNHQSEEELKRADPQRVRKERTDGGLRTSQIERDNEHQTEPARRCSGDHSPDPQVCRRDSGEQDLAFLRAGRGTPGQDAPPRRHN